MNAFFIEFSFSENVSGFRCDCKGTKTYSIDYYESIDRCIDDAAKIIKKQDAGITFQTFTGYESIDLLRVIRNYDGSLTAIHWKRNNSGFVSETWTDEKLKAGKATIKKYVLEAVQLHREQEAA